MKLQIALQGLLLGLVFVPSLAVEEIYKWVDKDGKVHFSVRTGDNAEVVKPKNSIKADEPRFSKRVSVEKAKSLAAGSIAMM
ncbi:DUF4124 domain-containing protein [Aeromonas molluscorum]|uniref:DUF4124 domain-containing protein n=1 Tax=Aeromonas molluscorum TaxID=271417 RepID=UPI003F1CF06A